MFEKLKSIIENFAGFISQPDYFRFSLKGQILIPYWGLAQYFYTSECAKEMASRLNRFDRPCCLCTPMIGKAWQDMGRIVRILDIDERFQFLHGFRQFDIRNPATLNEEFDVIVVDPPFDVEIENVLKAVNTLAKHDYGKNLAILSQTKIEASIIEHFKPYGLMPTYYHPDYCNVKKSAQQNFMYYANFAFGATTTKPDRDFSKVSDACIPGLPHVRKTPR